MGEIVVIMAMSIPIVGVISWAVMRVGRLKLEEARIHAGVLDPDSAAELVALRDEVEQMRQELDQLHERVDFTERALVQPRDPPRLPERS